MGINNVHNLIVYNIYKWACMFIYSGTSQSIDFIQGSSVLLMMHKINCLIDNKMQPFNLLYCSICNQNL